MNRIRFKKSSALKVAAFLALSIPCALPALAQNNMPAGVSMTVYPVHNHKGSQTYKNQYGQTMTLPGNGVNGDSVAVYTGPQGGQWYVDRTNQPVLLASPGSTPPPSNESNHNNAGKTAAAAGLGAAAGAALGTMAGSTVPYGTPMYWGYGHEAPYYYGSGGNKVFVNQQDTVNNVHFNNWNNQQNWYQNQVVNGAGQWHHQYNAAGNPYFMHDQGMRSAEGAMHNENNVEGEHRGFRRGGDDNAAGEGGEGRRGFRHRGGDDNHAGTAGDEGRALRGRGDDDGARGGLRDRGGDGGGLRGRGDGDGAGGGLRHRGGDRDGGGRRGRQGR